ncbi:hypothetical protein QTI33_26970 [Variovorax sp. J22P271]|uniref:hypothetical protein n=1 Tax=Variovorax davisae TaxID=3053515 RepID=UPI0025756D0F|nr:hypothetical protein [Variovorax sp. J22P271]MDM0035804.1 hypothetical protein [Variovorax sp. J22P271]
MLACFGALRTAIHEARRQHSDALRDHLIPAGSPFEFRAFDWRPRGSQRFNMPAQLSPETPIDEISMRSGARDALRNLSIFCIDDLSAISEQELLNEEAIGAKTVGRLREALARVGLDFLPNATAAGAGQARQADAAAPAGAEPEAAMAGPGRPRFVEVRKLLSEQARQSRDTSVSESMDWMGLYAYPSQLLRLRPGDSGVFVCPPAWRGRLGTVCGVWVKGNTDWAARFPPDTPWKDVFWTEAHVDGLKVVRAPLAGASARELPRHFVFAPRSAVSMPEPGLPRLDQVVSLWRSPSKANGGRRVGPPRDLAMDDQAASG